MGWIELALQVLGWRRLWHCLDNALLLDENVHLRSVRGSLGLLSISFKQRVSQMSICWSPSGVDD